VAAHLGLTPGRYQSGETDVQGKISRRGDELARTAFYEAAHTLLVRSRKWSSLRAWGMHIAKRRGMARARVAVSRKLAIILHRMWRDQTTTKQTESPYRPNISMNKPFLLPICTRRARPHLVLRNKLRFFPAGGKGSPGS
jgi:hypothetical protein